MEVCLIFHGVSPGKVSDVVITKYKLRDLREENCILAGDRGSTLDWLNIKNENGEEEKLISIAITNCFL